MKGLPRHLREAVASVSTTVQQLVYAVALHASGMPEEPRPEPQDRRTTLSGAEDIACLQSYVYGLATPLVLERCALGLAVLAGRVESEITEFFGFPAKDKLKRLRAAARRRH